MLTLAILLKFTLEFLIIFLNSILLHYPKFYFLFYLYIGDENVVRFFTLDWEGFTISFVISFKDFLFNEKIQIQDYSN